MLVLIFCGKCWFLSLLDDNKGVFSSAANLWRLRFLQEEKQTFDSLWLQSHYHTFPAGSILLLLLLLLLLLFSALLIFRGLGNMNV